MAIQGDYNLGPMQGLNLADLTLPFPVPPPDYSQAYGAGLPVSAEPGIVQSASTSPLNLPTQPDIPASSQPGFNFLGWLGNTLQSTGAGLQGRPDPVIQRRLQEAQMKRQEEQAVTQKFNVLFDFVKHMDVDEKTMAQLLGAFTKTFPDTGEYLKAQGINLADISIGRKGEKLTLKNRDVAEGQYIDPVTKQPITAGKYDIEGEWKRGQFTPKGFSPTEKEAKTYDQLLIDEAQRQFPKDTKAQEAFVAKRKKEQAVQIRVEGARGAGQAGVEGREAGYQNVLAKRLDRIRQETEATTGGRPLDPTTQERVSGLYAARRQVANIETNLDPEFLGPIKGTGTAFEVRRRVGSYIDSPLGSKEVIFRESLADAADMLLRARSGAQINEQEYKRLSGMLPRATDEEKVFRAGLLRFDNELAKSIESRIKLGTTPRGQLGNVGGQVGGNQLQHNTSKSGKPIISRDGGKTWEYE